MGDLSANFSLAEFAVSGSFPHLVEPVPQQFVPNVTKLVTTILQPMRTAWGRPFTVNSGYRSPLLNEAVGGSLTSQHRSAAAVDFVTADQRALFYSLLAHPDRYPCGQTIWYPKKGFMHVALPSRRYAEPSFFVSTRARRYTRIISVEQATRLGV